ncbi:MAG: NADH-quinone oxidoreductase subunit C, partial [Planctomycetota bacterium]
MIPRRAVRAALRDSGEATDRRSPNPPPPLVLRGRRAGLIDITGVDYPTRDRRFDVVWHFLSMYQNHRIRVKAAVREE